MMLRRFLLSAVLIVLPLWAHADWAADRDGSIGMQVVTTLATAVDEPVPFVVVYMSDLDASFWAAMDTASDTDGKTIRVSTSDGTTQLACVPIGVNTSTDTGCLIFLGTGMSASVDVDYRIYVGNASLSMPAASAGEQLVFAAYAGVYFPGVDTRDWTSGGRTLTATGTPGTAASGYEGITAATYNGTSQYHSYSGTQAVSAWGLTLEYLVRPTSDTADSVIGGLCYSGANQRQAIAYTLGNGASANTMIAQFRGTSSTISTATSSGTYSANDDLYIAFSRSGATGTSLIYKDGANSGSDSTTIAAWGAPDRFTIGSRITNAGVTNYATGNFSAALLSDSVHTADYMTTMQDNWAGTMYSTGAWTALDSGCTSGSTGWVLFQTGATTSASGTLVDWTNPSNAIIDDPTYALVNLDPGTNYETEYLNLTNIAYGTQPPVGADSYTVTVRIKKYRGSGAGDEINDLTVQFIDETGTRIGDNKADVTTNWPTTAGTFDYTITGHTFDGTEFDADSGIAIRATGIDSATDCDALVVTGWIKIDWTCPGSGAFPLLLISEE